MTAAKAWSRFSSGAANISSAIFIRSSSLSSPASGDFGTMAAQKHRKLSKAQKGNDSSANQRLKHLSVPLVVPLCPWDTAVQAGAYLMAGLLDC